MKLAKLATRCTCAFALFISLFSLLHCQTEDAGGRKVLLSIEIDSTYLKFGKIWVGYTVDPVRDTIELRKMDSITSIEDLKRLPVVMPENGRVRIIIKGYQSGTGRLIYEEVRDLDMATGKLISSNLQLDLTHEGFRKPEAKISIIRTLISIKDTIDFIGKVTDTDGIVFSYAWDFLGNGKFGSEFAFENEPIRAAMAYPDSGRFRAVLRIKDASKKAYYDTAYITVLLDEPRSDAGLERTVAVGDTLWLHGKGYDSLGRIVAREWKTDGDNYGATKDGDTLITVPLVAGKYKWYFRVTDDDGNLNEDSVIINATYRRDAYLSQLSLGGLSIVPEFDRTKFNYSLEVDYGVDSVTLNSRSEDPDAQIQFLGADPARHEFSAVIPLQVGGNFIRLTVLAQDSSQKNDYNLYVTRKKNQDAHLSGLTLSSGVLVPNFSDSIFEYSVTLENGQSELIITPTASDKINAKLWVNDSIRLTGAPANPISIGIGIDTIDIHVIAHDDTTQNHYLIIVSRLPSHDATLDSLDLSIGGLKPQFDPNILRYADTVANSVSSIGLKAVVRNPASKVFLDGNAIASGKFASGLPLRVGNNVFKIKVLSEGGDSGIYQLTIRRLSSNAKLGRFMVGTGKLYPDFDSGTFDYVDTVPASIDSLGIEVLAADSAVRSIRIKESVSYSISFSKAIPIKDGNNIVSIGVVAEDGSFSTYTLSVYKKNGDATLSSLIPQVGLLKPNFDKSITKYSINLPNADSGISFKAIVSSGLASAYLNGKQLIPGVESFISQLRVGTQQFKILVQSESGDSLAYLIDVHRMSVNANISKLAIDNAKLTPTFSPAVISYRDTVPPGAKLIHLYAKAEDSAVQSISIQGVNFPGDSGSADIPWSPIGAPINVAVTVVPQEGPSKTYSVKICGPGFIKTFTTKDDDNVVAIEPDANGGFAFLDLVSRSGDAINSILVKSNSDGDTLWSRQVGKSAIPNGMLTTANHSYLMFGSGHIPGHPDLDAYISEVDSLGKITWERFIGSGSKSEEMLSGTQTTDGGFAIAGYLSDMNTGEYNYYVLRLNNIGDTLWTRSFGVAADNEVAYSIRQLSDGGVAVIGENFNGDFSSSRVCAARIDAVGNLKWLKTFCNGSVATGKTFEVGENGAYIVAGSIKTSGASKYDAMMLTINSDGDSLGMRTVDSQYGTQFTAMMKNPGGGYAFVGAANGSGADAQDGLLIITDGSLNVISRKTFGGDKKDYFQSLNKSLDGGYLLSGSTYSFGSQTKDCMIIKTNPQGNIE